MIKVCFALARWTFDIAFHYQVLCKDQITFWCWRLIFWSLLLKDPIMCTLMLYAVFSFGCEGLFKRCQLDYLWAGGKSGEEL